MSPGRWIRRVDPVAGLMICATAIPVVWAVARGINDGWLPLGDQALLQVRAHDVLTGHHPLLGTASSAALNRAEPIALNHPGPLMFDALAVPVRLFGSAGVALGVGLVNIAAATVGCLFAHRRGGRAATALAALSFIVLGWAAGSEALFDPFNPIAAMMPCLACIFLMWSAVDLDTAAVPWLLGVATFCVQLNNSYLLFLVPATGVACVIHAVRARRAKVARWRTVAISSGVVLALTWSQPLLEQLVHGADGNLALMWRAVGKVSDSLGPETGTEIAAATLSLPPWWSRSHFDGVRLFTPTPSLAWAVCSLVVTLGASAYACRWTWRRGWPTEATALLTVSFSVPIAWVAATQTPMSAFFGINPDYSRWLWPVSVFIWFAAALTLWRLVAPRVHAVAGERALLVVSGVVLLSFALLNVPRHISLRNEQVLADRLSVAVPLIDEAAANIDTQQVLYRPPVGYDTYGPPLLARLQAQDVEFFVDDEVLVRQFGERRRLGDRVIPELGVRTGVDAVEASDGPSTLAYVSELTDAQQRELLDLVTEIEGLLAGGRISLSEAGRGTVDLGLAPAWFTELSTGVLDPADISRSLSLAEAVDSGQLAADSSEMTTLRRFAELRHAVEDSTAAIVLTTP